MNVMVSLLNSPMAHPPRSNPFLRSSSDAPPFPCITPSTATCVVVVNFMIAVPFSLVGGAPRGRPLTLRRTPLPRSDTASRISSRISGTPVVSAPTARPCRGDCAPLPRERCGRSRRPARRGQRRAGHDAGDHRVRPRPEGRQRQPGRGEASGGTPCARTWSAMECRGPVPQRRHRSPQGPRGLAEVIRLPDQLADLLVAVPPIRVCCSPARTSR
jgi:hypothetical protein